MTRRDEKTIFANADDQVLELLLRLAARNSRESDSRDAEKGKKATEAQRETRAPER